MTNKIIYKILISTLLFVGFLGFVRFSLAADVFLFSSYQEMSSGGAVVSLGIDTGPDKVNAVAGELSYDASRLELNSTSNANSIIPLWLDLPNKKNLGIVSFSGVIPGGFSGQGKIISLIFRSKTGDKDVAKFVKIKKIEILRNDGSGASVPVEIVAPPAGLVKSLDVSSAIDISAPETFKPILSQNDPLLGNQSYLIFNTTDKGSGVDKYFVSESNSPFVWTPAESPYLLQDQTLKSYVYVKVVDRAGNSLVVALEKEKEFYQTGLFWLFILILILLIVACGKLYRKRY